MIQGQGLLSRGRSDFIKDGKPSNFPIEYEVDDQIAKARSPKPSIKEILEGLKMQARLSL